MEMNPKEYIAAAIWFFNIGKGKIYYSQSQDRFYKYNALTNRVCICDNNGSIRTYYLCSNKQMNRYIKDEELEEWKEK